jgi:hypothetical protein
MNQQTSNEANDTNSIELNVFATQTATLGVTLYRSIIYQHPKQPIWKAWVQGRLAYDLPTQLSLTQRLILRGLVKRLNLGSSVLQMPRFQQRVTGFLVSATSAREVRFQIADDELSFRRKNRKSGLFTGRATVESQAVEDYLQSPLKSSVAAPIELAASYEDRHAVGQLHAVARQGVSIITDIDDTIKLTDVTDRNQMLKRTFVDPFEPIEGMNSLYRAWSERFNVCFHYVSSSPWQLYWALEQFLDDHHFPVGSIHLQWFSLREEFLKKWRLARRRKKASTIQDLLKRLPQRRFVLIGDSGERDPEIYAKLANKSPKQIAGILIRNIEQNPMDFTRLREFKSMVGNIPFRVFNEPSEIANVLDRWLMQTREARHRN